ATAFFAAFAPVNRRVIHQPRQTGNPPGSRVNMVSVEVPSIVRLMMHQIRGNSGAARSFPNKLLVSQHGGVRYDVVIIGSGFGGSVAALRLAEKGYSVAVLEAGRRFADDEFATTSWRTRGFLWAPALGCYGIQRINLLGNVLVFSGAGVGGGSLVYANTLYRPPR